MLKIKNKIKDCGFRIAEKLKHKAARYSLRRQRFFLIVFCVLFSVITISTVVQTFWSPSFLTDPLCVKPVNLQPHLGKSYGIPPPVISSASFLHVENFKHLLDSISLSDTVFYNKIIRERPQLQDSIRQFEKLFHAQSKQ